MKFNRKYLRISLRGLLVAMTITGVALGLYLKRVQDQIRAVAMIESLGGRCWYEFQLDENRIKLPESSEPSVMDRMRQLLGEHFFSNVVIVSLDEKAFTDDDVKLLVGLRHLKRLDLDGPKVTDATLKIIGRMQRLEELYLFDTLVTDDGLKDISKLDRLTGLSLSVSRITDDGIARLQSLAALEQLYLSNNTISDEGIQYLSVLPSLQSVEAFNTNVTSVGAAALPGAKLRFGSAAVASPLRSR